MNLHLPNQLISNSHCSTYYNKLVCVCGEWDIVNCLLFLQIFYL